MSTSTLVLTPEQLAIVQAPPDVDLLVIAAAGGGKTATSFMRMKHLHTVHHIALNEMCYITYSRRLADEVSKKYASVVRIGYIGTIDGLCSRLLHRLADAKGTTYVSTASNNIVDAIRAGTGLREFLTDIRYVFLDEAQDIDRDRFSALSMLFLGKRLMVTGDPRQCIYQGLFDADPSLMRQLRPDARVHLMTVTFRCSPSIVRFVNAAFDYPGLPDMRAQSGRPRGALPRLVVLHDSSYAGILRDDIVDCLVKVVRSLVARGAAASDIAILAPTVRASSLRLLNRVRTRLEESRVAVDFNKREYQDFDRVAHAGAVYIGTIHSFKGSERKHVVLANFYVGSGAWIPTVLDDGCVAPNPDFQNLLYVAVTRASETLTMVESCHYLKDNERLGCLQRAIDADAGIMAVSTVTSCELGKFRAQQRTPRAAVTEILQALTPQLSADLAAAVAPCRSDPPADLTPRFQIPAHFVVQNDTELYGQLMEAVLTRELLRGTGAAAAPPFHRNMMRLLSMPVYISKDEFRMLLACNPDALPAEKFAHTQISASEILEYVASRTAGIHGPADAFMRRVIAKELEVMHVHIIANCDDFYARLRGDWKHMVPVMDEARPTHQVVVALWNSVLFRNYHKTQLGVYWLPHHTMTERALLPRGASGWEQYLHSFASAYDEQLGVDGRALRPTDCQQDVAKDGVSGIIDAIDPRGRIIDFKCCAKDSTVVGPLYRAQVQAYRHMIGEGACRNADCVLFSALSLRAYTIAPDALSDARVWQVIQQGK